MAASPSRRAALRRALLLPLLPALALAGCGDDSTGPSNGRRAGIAFVNLSGPVDLTPDGRIAVLTDGTSPLADLYFYYPRTGALSLRTQVGDPFRTFATAVSATGVVTALHGEPVEAGFWTAASEWTHIPSPYRAGCGADLGGAWDVSADGSVVVGLVWNGCGAEGFRWDGRGSGIMTPLQRLGAPFPGSLNPPANRATVISDDGAVIAGWAQTDLVDRWAAVWQADGSGELLTGLAQDTPSEVLSITADGAMAAGSWGSHGFTWTEASGMVDIGQLPGADPVLDPTFPNAIAAGGKLIFGGSGSPFFSTPQAFVWTAAGGMRPLAEVITAAGVTIPAGYLLTNVLAASTDGRVVLGTAWDDRLRQVSFVLTLPLSAYGL